MSKIIFGDKELQQIYIYNYYFWQNMLIGTLRLFGGPVMIGLGLWFYFTDKENPLLFGSILTIYGLYYSLRPYIFIYFKREKLDQGAFDVEIESTKITISDERGSHTFDFTDFKKIKKYKNWFALYFSNQSTLFLPENQLKPNEIEILTHKVI
jgi:hypothetical protein